MVLPVASNAVFFPWNPGCGNGCMKIQSSGFLQKSTFQSSPLFVLSSNLTRICGCEVDLSLLTVRTCVSLQLDIEVSFSMPNLSQALQPPELLAENGQSVCEQRGVGENTMFGPFGVYVLATDDLREQTSIYFQILQSPGEALKILVCSDQSKSSVASNVDTEAFGSFVRVYDTDQFLTLRILVCIHLPLFSRMIKNLDNNALF